jgi:predicted nuclease of restriction endonuclease-like RecB superfamily
MTTSKKWRDAVTSREYRERLRKASKKTWSNPEFRKKMSKIQKKAYENPDLRKKIDKAVTKWWKEHPHVRKEYSDRLKNYFIKNPKDFADKFYNGKNNPFHPHIKTKLGLVRSKGEATIANFLYNNKIEAKYEAKTLMLDGYICVPDFYLEKYNTYIEFYGGYPGSRTKKVLKNKLYKKHKLRVIAITPSELRDLNKEILGYLKRSR